MATIDAYKNQRLFVDGSISEEYQLVKRIANHLSWRLPSTIAVEDLIQAGMEGLLQAKQKFDPSRGVAFEMFAKTRVRGAMLDEVRRISYSSRGLVRTKKEHDKAIQDLSQELGRSPKNREIAERLGIDSREYESERLKAEGAEFLNADELEQPIEDFNVQPMGPEDILDQSESLSALEEAIIKLPERNQIILALYYQEELNLKEIGEILNVSESRVSQILSETAGRLRKILFAHAK